MKTYIILPAYCEGKVIKEVIASIKKEGYKNIIVVDDGSSDNTYEEAKSTGVITISHPINRGKGAATQTGIDAAKLLNADVIVTMDSDGQHDPKDIKKLVKPIIDQKADVVIGSRMINNKDMPQSRILMNKIANIVTYIFFGIMVSDSQSGLRAYSKKAYNSVYTYMDRYEFESEMLGQIKDANLRIKEVPIKVIYTDYSKSKYKHMSKFSPQGLTNGIKMVVRLIENSLIK
ncbi:glycosyltransferase family 2 protein [Candidatus Dojkabacteria bacterium HGW-Dojkabacteria-1]|uniref:Glycosyltransferase family 2 protein n=1 Tax=Candidatus Dojkabacteria bacterium HGW-Dojkabacteria-1 TaxID=2013761 RepID=A0A2N2F391_9BACT|nr:MAG: glycosyltransferase family 2 protein [Candidatus Dojkabacteria bacterium HGW-Dojkabacteria-1]